MSSSFAAQRRGHQLAAHQLCHHRLQPRQHRHSLFLGFALRSEQPRRSQLLQESKPFRRHGRRVASDSGPDYHQIDANYFADRPLPVNPTDPNGFETIRIGDSTQSLSNSFTTVKTILFERTDGEIEVISNKSGSNTFRYNTFREVAATLTLRHGNDNRVEGNFFLGQDTNNSGGIRVIGERQTIVNNYIANVDDRAGGAISISAGVPNSALNEYFQVKDAVIAHNTIVNVGGPAITFDDGLGSSGRTLLGPECDGCQQPACAAPVQPSSKATRAPAGHGRATSPLAAALVRWPGTRA